MRNSHPPVRLLSKLSATLLISKLNARAASLCDSNGVQRSLEPNLRPSILRAPPVRIFPSSLLLLLLRLRDDEGSDEADEPVELTESDETGKGR